MLSEKDIAIVTQTVDELINHIVELYKQKFPVELPDQAEAINNIFRRASIEKTLQNYHKTMFEQYAKGIELAGYPLIAPLVIDRDPETGKMLGDITPTTISFDVSVEQIKNLRKETEQFSNGSLSIDETGNLQFNSFDGEVNIQFEFQK